MSTVVTECSLTWLLPPIVFDQSHTLHWHKRARDLLTSQQCYSQLLDCSHYLFGLECCKTPKALLSWTGAHALGVKTGTSSFPCQGKPSLLSMGPCCTSLVGSGKRRCHAPRHSCNFGHKKLTELDIKKKRHIFTFLVGQVWFCIFMNLADSTLTPGSPFRLAHLGIWWQKSRLDFRFGMGNAGGATWFGWIWSRQRHRFGTSQVCVVDFINKCDTNVGLCLWIIIEI